MTFGALYSKSSRIEYIAYREVYVDARIPAHALCVKRESKSVKLIIEVRGSHFAFMFFQASKPQSLIPDMKSMDTQQMEAASPAQLMNSGLGKPLVLPPQRLRTSPGIH